MTRQQIRDFEPPKIERGIPIPPNPYKPRPAREPLVNPWDAWLLALIPGESFVTDYFDGANVRSYLKRLGIPFEVRSLQGPRNLGGAYWRFWVVGETTIDFVKAFKHQGDGI